MTAVAWRVDVSAPANGRLRKSTVRTFLGLEEKWCDKVDIEDARERRRLAKELNKRTEIAVEELERLLMEGLAAARQQRQERQERATSPPPTPAAELLDSAPDVIRRPLCLVAGRAYAACWLYARVERREGVDEFGAPVTYDPPRVETGRVLLVVRDDGKMFADAPVRGALPPAKLGVEVRLSEPVPPDMGWSGAGVKRFLAGERPDAADVFRRLTGVVNSFIDFSRSLGPQDVMCELAGCYVLVTYLLDAFDVVGYMWPNGDKGTGKTHFLIVMTELSYLGLLILAGGRYATLRDLADYGATLAFDDAEGVMDVKRADPDKRALLLAGNRRGATITVKEKEPDGQGWRTRFVHAFCPRLFSAIRLPDDVLGSRTIIVPLVRSSDEVRACSQPLVAAGWPCDRRRLLDDLWALGLTSLPELRAFDTQAAARSGMLGRELEPWRAIFAVALWLDERHGVAGLFGRLKALAESYRTERGDLEASDQVRIAIQALRDMVKLTTWTGEFSPKQLADVMNRMAEEADLAEPDKPFTTPKKVGWMCKRLRFRRAERDKKAKHWIMQADELEALAGAYGMAV
jgi:hypothetical protein